MGFLSGWAWIGQPNFFLLPDQQGRISFAVIEFLATGSDVPLFLVIEDISKVGKSIPRKAHSERM
jgi:hypothetical protein